MREDVESTIDCVAAAPHAPLPTYYADKEQRREYLTTIFDNTAADYDRIERVLALGSGAWYRKKALVRAGLQHGMRVLDVGVGTGLLTKEAVRIVGDAALLTGIDPSVGMMKNARVPKGVVLLKGRAEDIPMENASVDFVTMGYALRHVDDLLMAFSSFHRVLKPSGRLCLLEITRPEYGIARALLKLYLRGVIPAIARLVSDSRETARLFRYYWDTIDACAPPAQILETLRAAGFRDVRRQVTFGIFSEYQAIRC